MQQCEYKNMTDAYNVAEIEKRDRDGVLFSGTPLSIIDAYDDGTLMSFIDDIVYDWPVKTEPSDETTTTVKISDTHVPQESHVPAVSADDLDRCDTKIEVCAKFEPFENDAQCIHENIKPDRTHRVSQDHDLGDKAQSSAEMLIMMKDTDVPLVSNRRMSMRDIRTVPPGLAARMSCAFPEKLGMTTRTFLPSGVAFGPCQGITCEHPTSTKSSCCWKVFQGSRVHHYIDSSDDRESNWMKFVQPATQGKHGKHNLDIIQLSGELYFKTSKDIMANSELLLNFNHFSKYRNDYDERYFPMMDKPADTSKSDFTSSTTSREEHDLATFENGFGSENQTEESSSRSSSYSSSLIKTPPSTSESPSLLSPLQEQHQLLKNDTTKVSAARKSRKSSANMVSILREIAAPGSQGAIESSTQHDPATFNHVPGNDHLDRLDRMKDHVSASEVTVNSVNRGHVDRRSEKTTSAQTGTLSKGSSSQKSKTHAIRIVVPANAVAIGKTAKHVTQGKPTPVHTMGSGGRKSVWHEVTGSPINVVKTASKRGQNNHKSDWLISRGSIPNTNMTNRHTMLTSTDIHSKRSSYEQALVAAERENIKTRAGGTGILKHRSRNGKMQKTITEAGITNKEKFVKGWKSRRNNDLLLRINNNTRPVKIIEHTLPTRPVPNLKNCSSRERDAGCSLKKFDRSNKTGARDDEQLFTLERINKQQEYIAKCEDTKFAMSPTTAIIDLTSDDDIVMAQTTSTCYTRLNNIHLEKASKYPEVNSRQRSSVDRGQGTQVEDTPTTSTNLLVPSKSNKRQKLMHLEDSHPVNTKPTGQFTGNMSNRLNPVTSLPHDLIISSVIDGERYCSKLQNKDRSSKQTRTRSTLPTTRAMEKIQTERQNIQTEPCSMKFDFSKHPKFSDNRKNVALDLGIFASSTKTSIRCNEKGSKGKSKSKQQPNFRPLLGDKSKYVADGDDATTPRKEMSSVMKIPKQKRAQKASDLMKNTLTKLGAYGRLSNKELFSRLCQLQNSNNDKYEVNMKTPK